MACSPLQSGRRAGRGTRLLSSNLAVMLVAAGLRRRPQRRSNAAFSLRAALFPKTGLLGSSAGLLLDATFSTLFLQKTLSRATRPETPTQPWGILGLQVSSRIEGFSGFRVAYPGFLVSKSARQEVSSRIEGFSGFRGLHRYRAPFWRVLPCNLAVVLAVARG